MFVLRSMGFGLLVSPHNVGEQGYINTLIAYHPIIIIIIIIISLFKEDYILSKHTYLTYGPL